MGIENLGIQNIELRFDDNELGNINPIAGDTKTRGYLVQLFTANGELVPASPDIEVRLYGVNMNYPDKAVYSVGKIVGDKYKVHLTTDMVSKAGMLRLQMEATYKGEEIIQSEARYVKVGESLRSGSVAGSDLVVDFTKLTQAIEKAETLEDQYNVSLARQGEIEEDVTQKHEDIVGYRNELKTVFDTEQARQEAENLRQQNNAAWLQAEQLRKDAEEARKQAQILWQEYLATVKQEEELRQSSETEKQRAEELREEAENLRQKAEDLRNQNNTAWAEAERLRELAEEARQEAERLRAEAERLRADAEEERAEIFAGWDFTMEGVIPKATVLTAGIVKLDKSGEDTATSIGTFNNTIDEIPNKVPIYMRSAPSNGGVLLNTNMEPGQIFLLNIQGMSYNDPKPFDFFGYVYAYLDKGETRFLSSYLFSKNKETLTIKVFMINGKISIWIPPRTQYTLYSVEINSYNVIDKTLENKILNYVYPVQEPTGYETMIEINSREIYDYDSKYVAKEDGKGLSTNDYTTEDKNALATLKTHNHDNQYVKQTAYTSDMANKISNDSSELAINKIVLKAEGESTSGVDNNTLILRY